MSDTKGQAEPTMEEILASIRRIISEDDAAPEDEQEPTEQEAAPEPEPEPQPEPEPEPEDEVMELTQKVADDGTVVDLAAERAAMEAQAEPEPQAAPSGLSDLAHAAVGGHAIAAALGGGRTLEEIVREALVPEVKAWLESNLSPLVEQIVRDEIKKMARRSAE
jgi:cell pole-organizing protein PopZ